MDGIVYKNVLATYTHLHALGVPQWAGAFIALANQHVQVPLVAVNYQTNMIQEDLTSLVGTATHSPQVATMPRSSGVLHQGLTVQEFRDLVKDKLSANRKTFTNLGAEVTPGCG